VGTPTDDPYQRQWNLKPRIEALQAEAKSTRRELADRYQTDETRLGIERDRVAREQYAADQAAKSADIQVQRETRDAAAEAKKAAEFEALAAKEERSRDRAAAEESREIAEVARVKQETHLARSRQATLDAAELRERAATQGRRVTELEVEREGVRTQAMKAEAELDKMEQQAKLLEDARRKYAEADLAGASDPQRANAALLEAERLEAQSAGIEVNRGTIRQSIPEFPAVTPGIDLPAPPLPEGAQADAPTEEPVAPGPSSTEDPDQPDGDAEAARAGIDDPLGIDGDLAAVTTDAASSTDAAADVDAAADTLSTDVVAATDVTIDSYDSVGPDSPPDADLYSNDAMTDTFATVPEDSFSAPVADVSFDGPTESSDSYDGLG
jgi:hypothetical protein